MAAPVYIANEFLTLNGVPYSPGDIVDTTGWTDAYLTTALRLGWLSADEGGIPGIGRIMALHFWG